MKLYLELALERLRVDAEYFFRMAHTWRFQRCVDVRTDVAAYDTFGLIPRYVCDYLDHLKTVGGIPTPPIGEFHADSGQHSRQPGDARV